MWEYSRFLWKGADLRNVLGTFSAHKGAANRALCMQIVATETAKDVMNVSQQNKHNIRSEKNTLVNVCAGPNPKC